MYTLNEILTTAPAEKEAIIVSDGLLLSRQIITYGELKNDVHKLKLYLGTLVHTRQKPIIAVILPNCYEFIISLFSIFSLGGVAAPLHPEYTRDELLFYARDMKAEFIITRESSNMTTTTTTIIEEVSRILGLPLILLKYTSEFCRNEDVSLGHKDPSHLDIRTINMMEQQHKLDMDSPSSVLPDDIALLLYTSGSTGSPKAVLLTHMNLWYSVNNTIESYQLNDKDCCLLVMPLFHVHGMIGCLLSTLASKGTIVLPPKFSVTKFWQLCKTYQCTWFSAVPTIHLMLLEQQQRHDESEFKIPKISHELRFIRSCSSYLSVSSWRRLEDIFQVPVLQAYAMTEASHQITTNQLFACKKGSVGRTIGSIEVAILDPQNGSITYSPEIVGDILIRGPTLMTYGYRNVVSPSSDFIEDHWFKTGDIGYLDHEGFLFLQGRSKEMINRGGEKLSPLEIASVLMSHPKVLDGIVFGVPHPIYGESVHAAIIPIATFSSGSHENLSSELDLFCRSHLATFKCPERIHILDHLPKTTTGKIHLPSLLKIIRHKI